MDKKRIQVVAAVGIPVLLLSFFLVSRSARDSERKIRQNIEAELSSKLVELAENQAKLEALTREKAALETAHLEKMTALESQLKELDDNAKLLTGRVEALSKEKDDILMESAEKDKKISELSKKIRGMELERADLASQLKKLQDSAPAAPVAETREFSRRSDDSVASVAGEFAEKPAIDAVKLGKIVVQKSSGYAARIQHVNPLYGFIVVNAGTRDGLKNGTVLNVIRDKRLIGRAVVEKARDKSSAAIILPEWTTERVEAGDFISKF